MLPATKIKLCKLLMFFILLIAPLLYAILSVFLTPRAINQHRSDGGDGSTGRVITLQAELHALDLGTNTMKLDWTLVDDTALSCNSGDSASECDTVLPVDIYFDTNLLVPSGEERNTSNVPPTTPVFNYNATAFVRNKHSNAVVFHTDLDVENVGNSGALSYPFDRYYAIIFAFAREQQPNGTETEVTLRISYTAGVLLGFSVDSDASVLSDGDGSNDVLNRIVIRRSDSVRTYALIIVIGIWIITLMMCVSVMYSWLFGYLQRVELLLIPPATIFTFTQLRATLPGAPADFGTVLDIAGILPCMMLMVISAAVAISIVVFSDPTKDRETWLTRFFNQPATKEVKEVDDDVQEMGNRAQV